MREVILALRGSAAPVVAIELPSGIHPDEGLVGDTVWTDVTLAFGPPADGLFRPARDPSSVTGTLSATAGAPAPRTQSCVPSQTTTDL